MMQKSRNTIYSHLTKYICTQGISLHPATVYLCSFKELYLFNFKEMIYLLTVKEIHSYKEQSTLFTKSLIIRGNYILSRNYIHFKELISSFKEIYPRSRKTYSFREIISIQGNIIIKGTYIRSSSRPCVHSRKLYSLSIVTFA